MRGLQEAEGDATPADALAAYDALGGDVLAALATGGAAHRVCAPAAGVVGAAPSCDGEPPRRMPARCCAPSSTAKDASLMVAMSVRGAGEAGVGVAEAGVGGATAGVAEGRPWGAVVVDGGRLLVVIDRGR